MTYPQMDAERKSGFQPDSADGLPAGRFWTWQAGSLPTESGETPNFRRQISAEHTKH